MVLGKGIGRVIIAAPAVKTAGLPATGKCKNCLVVVVDGLGFIH
jgi:hypothetical protein